MALIYDSTNHIFLKQEQQKHSGMPACSKESPAESFYVNHFINISQDSNLFFEFDTPLFYTLGGTINYYGQDFWSIFTNISRPFIKYVFTANTEHFGTGTTIVHNVYRILYKDYLDYGAEIIRTNIEQNKNYTLETVEETVVDDSGNSKTTITTKKTSSSSTSEKAAPTNFSETISNLEEQAGEQNSELKKMLNNPILTITATTTGISSSNYILFLDEYQKSIGDFQQQMFQDYAQYFITTQFEFNREQAIGLRDFYQLSSGNTLTPIDYQQYYQETTPANGHIITGGTFSGITVYGNFFTYFLIPNKPNWQSPYVKGQLSTFSPTFFWSNTNDGDSFLLQVVYDSGDSQSFSGVVYSYPIEKSNSLLSTNDMLDLPDGDWSITRKTTDIVREYSVPLAYGKTFWYRIGNVKELINIFGVKQKVISFSSIESAITSSDTYKDQVYIQSDSPHTEDSSILTYPDYLDDDISILQKYNLSGTVSGSVITGATVVLGYPNGNYTTQTTDLLGNYLFTQVTPGIYGITVFYTGYDTYGPLMINVSGNTIVPTIYLGWVWGNQTETWGSLADHLFI